MAGYVFFAEIFPNHLRAKGLALSGATIALANLIYLQAAPTAFANIGWRFYLVSSENWYGSHGNFKMQAFISICAVGVVWVWISIPETKGLPLEEVAAIFGDGDEVIVRSSDIRVDLNNGQMAGQREKTAGFAVHLEEGVADARTGAHVTNV